MAEKNWVKDNPLIAVFWHGRLLMMLKAWLSRDDQAFNMLISNHSDGTFIAKAAEAFGFKWVVGSSNRQGAKAVRNILAVLEKGEVVGMTPDGPRGPRYVSKISPVTIARMADVDIFPSTFSVKRGFFLKSWDRFLLPLPFNRGVFVYGDPVIVRGSPKSDEELRIELENKLKEINDLADEMCGWPKGSAA